MKRVTKSSGPARPAARQAAQSVGEPLASRAALAAGSVNSPAAELPATAQLDGRLLELLGQRVEATRRELQAAQAAGEGLDLAALLQAAVRRAASVSSSLGLETQRAVELIKHVVSLSYEAAQVSEPVAYLGPIYSYSYLAAAKHFGMAGRLVPVATIAAVFDELVRGQAAYGVVPIENSTDGRVVDTLGMFARWPVTICGEVLLPIHHCLLGRASRAEINEIYSKPQAMSQCRDWLSKHVPDARLIEISSTAAAARLAAEKPGAAAVASREAGIHYGLAIIDENIEDSHSNVTRFAIIGNRETQPTGRDKTSLMFQLPHRPCALAEVMDIFREARLNLTWIESFPLADRLREYLFFVELEGHVKSKKVAAALRSLKKQTLRLEVLGSYAIAAE